MLVLIFPLLVLIVIALVLLASRRPLLRQLAPLGPATMLPPLSGARYFTLGLGLFALKYAIDALVARFAFGVLWLPWQYFIPGTSYSILRLPQATLGFYFTLVLLSLPFIAIGLWLTVRRLATLRRSPMLTAVFFVPFVNLIFFIWLALAAPLPQPQLQVVEQEDGAALARALAASAIVVPLALGYFWFGTHLLGNYGWGLFIGLPFGIG